MACSVQMRQHASYHPVDEPQRNDHTMHAVLYHPMHAVLYHPMHAVLYQMSPSVMMWHYGLGTMRGPAPYLAHEWHACCMLIS